MAFLVWNKSFSVGIESIDEQHRKLFELIGDFYKQINNRSNQEIISALIQGMKDYAIMHFETEERYMIEFNFPALYSHKREHDDFISKVADLESRYNAGQVILSFEITDFLKKWIQNHIKGVDMRYSEFLQRQGVR